MMTSSSNDILNKRGSRRLTHTRKGKSSDRYDEGQIERCKMVGDHQGT